MTLLAFAAVRRAAAAPLLLVAGRAAIHRYLLSAGYTAANPPHAAAVVDSWDRQTDRRTDTVPLHRPVAYYAAVSKNNVLLYVRSSCEERLASACHVSSPAASS